MKTVLKPWLAALAPAALIATLIGALLAAPAFAQGRSFIRDAEIERTLGRLSAPVFRAAGLRPDEVDILIVDDPSLNAFVATPRVMVLNTGLLRRFDRPETLIGVIAHEAGHIAGGHLASRAVAQRQAALPALAATAAGALAGAAAGSPQAATALALGGGESVRRSLLSFSRGQEAAADQAAVDYMSRAGIDPEGMLDILLSFRGQEVFQRDILDPYAITHPLSSERIDLLRRRIAESPSRGARLDPALAYWHDRMRTKLGAFLDRPETTLARLEGRPEDELSLYARAIAEHRIARADAALATLDRLMRLRPDDPYYWELRGQILYESARPFEAVAPLRRAVALAPEEPLIAGLLGRALLASGQDAEALTILQEAAREDPGEPGLLRDLALAYARAGREGEAALATAERFAVSGDLREAARLARRAQGLLPRGSPDWLRADDIAAAAEAAE